MVKFCPECGTRADSGKFCSECGARFNATFVANSSSDVSSSFQQAPLAAAKSFAGSGAFQPPPPPPPPPPTRPMASTFAGDTNGFASENRNTFNTSSSTRNSFGGAQAKPPPYGAKSVGYPPSASNGYQRQSSYGAAQPPPPPPPPPPPLPPARVIAPSPPPQDIPIAVPAAATGAEAQQLYEQCVSTIRAARGGNNEIGVAKFKQNCKSFGLHQMDVKSFHSSLVLELGMQQTVEFVPTLARLIPDDDKRKELVEYNAHNTPAYLRGSSVSSSFNETGRYSYTSSNSSGSPRASTASGYAPPPKKGMFAGRYADHPNCDLCSGQFDVTRPRHQCRLCGAAVCGACSPLKLLIPPGRQVDGAKGYDPSVPQRVCIQCGPELHPLQEDLARQFARSHNETIHEARGRLHVPYSASLEKECCNAADIIGNFFRDDWGASADRSIPVAFLQRAHGLAVMTIIKAGFMITGKIGTGLVIGKLPDGSWSPPSAIGTLGLGGGFEIGGELVEVMIILGSEGAVKVFHKPQVNLGAGLDLTVGPYGRSALAAAAASPSGLNANYSYSHSKGLYAGISLQGAVIATRGDLNRKFYGKDLTAADILTGRIEQPRAAAPLYEAINRALLQAEAHKEEKVRRIQLMGPCRICNCPQFVAHTTQIWNKNCKICKHVH